MAGTTIALAMRALFELCVPAVSGGQQTFPPELIVDLSPAERELYQVASTARVHRIKSSDGFILLEVEEPYCKIITADGNPADAVAPFLSGLKQMSARVAHDADTVDSHNIEGQLHLADNQLISIILAL